MKWARGGGGSTATKHLTVVKDEGGYVVNVFPDNLDQRFLCCIHHKPPARNKRLEEDNEEEEEERYM